jgi:hypothetical protein
LTGGNRGCDGVIEQAALLEVRAEAKEIEKAIDAS